MEIAIRWTMISISRRFLKVKCSSEKLTKKTVREHHGKKKEKFKTEESTSIVSISESGAVVNSRQKKTSPRGAHRKGYGQ